MVTGWQKYFRAKGVGYEFLFVGSLRDHCGMSEKEGNFIHSNYLSEKKETPRNEGLLNSAFRTNCSLTAQEKNEYYFFTNKFEHWNRWLLWAGRSQPMKKSEK